ncbi:MAG TPA: IPT/TIG domain-containing protein [Terriglobales bacterium]|nr:IPT/TIG domain-containing protein [Terriglobales bacterium]
MSKKAVPALIGFLMLLAFPSGCGNCSFVAVSLTSISPSTISTGSTVVIITVNGSGFRRDSQVVWNGVSLPTVFVSGTQLTATVPSTEIAEPGTISVVVFNPTTGGNTSVTGGVVAFSCNENESNALTVTIAP